MNRLKEIGRIKPKSALEVESSRLGIGFEKLDREVFDPERAYDKMALIGVKWVRLQSGWQRTERTRGVYDFAWLDSIVDNLISRGMTPWLCVCYGNELYDERAKTVFGAAGCMPVHDEVMKAGWANYCTALAAHYKGRVSHFEIWNEPDGSWNDRNPEDYSTIAAFNVDSARALRAGNPDAYIIGGSIAGNPVRFLNVLLECGVGEEVDAISFHEYTYAEETVRQKILSIAALREMYGCSFEIIQGESGSQSRSGGHGALCEAAWTERKQAKQLLRHMVTDLLCDVKFSSYFTCVDMIEALNGTVGDTASYLDYGYFGVLGAEFDEEGHSIGIYREKQSYYVLQNLASLLHGDLRVEGIAAAFLPDNAPHLGFAPTLSCAEISWGGFRLSGGARALAYWAPSNLMTTEYEAAATVEIALREECSAHKRVSLVDPMDGRILSLPEGMAEYDGRGGYTFRRLPVKDYPLFLVFGDIT